MQIYKIHTMGNLSNGSLLFFLCRNDYTLKHEFKRKDYRYTKIFPKPKKEKKWIFQNYEKPSCFKFIFVYVICKLPLDLVKPPNYPPIYTIHQSKPRCMWSSYKVAWAAFSGPAWSGWLVGTYSGVCLFVFLVQLMGGGFEGIFQLVCSEIQWLLINFLHKCNIPQYKFSTVCR